MGASDIIFIVLVIIPFVSLLGVIGATLALRKSNVEIRDHVVHILLACAAGIVGCIAVTVDVAPFDAVNSLEKEACAAWGYLVPYVFSYAPLYVILQWNLIDHSIWRTRVSSEQVSCMTQTGKSCSSVFTVLPIIIIVVAGWVSGSVGVDDDGADCESEMWLKQLVAAWAFTVTMISSIIVAGLRLASRIRISSITDEKSDRVFKKAFGLILLVSILGACVAGIRLAGVHDTEWGRVAIVLLSGMLHVVYPLSFVLSHIIRTFRGGDSGNWNTMYEGEMEFHTAGADITPDLYSTAMDSPMLRAAFLAFCVCADDQVEVSPGVTISSRVLVGAYKSSCSLCTLMTDHMVMAMKAEVDEPEGDVCAEAHDAISVQSPSTFPGKISGTFSEGTDDRVAASVPSSEVIRVYGEFSQRYMNASQEENVSAVLQSSIPFELVCTDVVTDVGNVGILSSTIFGILVTALAEEFLNVRAFDAKPDEMRVALDWVANLRRLSASRRAPSAGGTIGFSVDAQLFDNWEDFHAHSDRILADGTSMLGDGESYYDGASSTTFGDF